MKTLPLTLALLLFPAGAGAGADRPAVARIFSVGSFERVRIDGPYDVRLTTRQAPGARATGDARALDALTVSIEGQTLVVRARPLASGETPTSPTQPLLVTLATPLLRTASVNGGGRLTIAPMQTQRIDLSVNGAGDLRVTGIETDQLNATVVGAGTIHLAGRAQRALLQSQGSGTMNAPGLLVNDVTIRADGTGEVRAAARYTALITASGIGAISVDGKAACRVKTTGGAIVRCGQATGGGAAR